MVEEIPSEDCVSRHIDSPHKWHPDERKFLDERVFEFPAPDYVESLVWRKYKPTLAEVHALGCERQQVKRAVKPSWTYEGAITAEVGAIRAIRNQAGDGFALTHSPDEGQYHVHIGYSLVEGQDRIRQRRSDLKERLLKVFSPLEAHVCP